MYVYGGNVLIADEHIIHSHINYIKRKNQILQLKKNIDDFTTNISIITYVRQHKPNSIYKDGTKYSFDQL